MPDTIDISGPQLVQIHGMLTTGFTLSELELLLFSIDRTMDSVSTSASERVFDVIKQARRENWVSDLVLAAHNQKPGDPALYDFVRNHFGAGHLNPKSKLAVAASADPFSVSFLRNNNSVPFVNRVSLRDRLRQMFDIQNGPRILAVHSDLQKCGKSYTAELIRFLARHHQHRAVYVDVNEEWTAEFGPGHLAGLLAEQIGLDRATMPAREAQMARWNKELCRWLTRHIKTSDEFWWIVIDGLNQAPNLTVDLQDFIHEFAALVEKEDQPQHRLILISFAADNLPINLQARTIEDAILDRIGIQDLTAFFTQQVERVKTERNLDDSDVENAPETLAAWVHGELDNYPQEEQAYALELLIVKAMEQLDTF